MKLLSKTLRAKDLESGQVARMLALMVAHYDGVSEDNFRRDLREKDWVILLLDGDKICGFSTQLLFDHTILGKRVRILFSGDTIIEPSHWGSLALPLAWGRLLVSLCAADPKTDIYWLLTSKGYKTYRFLPVFFNEFSPKYDAKTPDFERALLNSVAERRFGSRYDHRSGILHAEPGAQRLREGIADIDNARLRDPHISYFASRNPGHRAGDELVCIARFAPDNLKPYIRRQL